MKILIAALLVLALAHAQFDALDSQMYSCDKNCCTKSNYSWNDSAQNCSAAENTAHYLGYISCRNGCYEEAQAGVSRVAPGNSMCCAPGFMMLAVLGSAMLSAEAGWKKRRRGDLNS